MARTLKFPWELFEALSNARGVTGSEGPVRKLLKAHLKGHADTMVTDAMGSLLVTKKGRRSANRILLGAHMDEVGFMVTKIEKSGLLRLAKVGGLDDRLLAGKRVRVGPGGAPGVLGTRPIHLLKGEETSKVAKLEDMFVDVGASTEDEARELASVGDPVSFDFTYESWGSGLVRGKAFDDRVGCAILAALVTAPSPVDFVAVFTTQEEIGLRGARVAARRFEPDVAVALEGTGAADTPARRAAALGAFPAIGKGPVLTRRDSSSISDKQVFAVMAAAADSAGVRWQDKRPGIGGTDAGEFHRARGGARSISLSVPCRYIHSPAAIAARSDIEGALLLAHAALPGLSLLKRPVGPRLEKP